MGNRITSLMFVSLMVVAACAALLFNPAPAAAAARTTAGPASLAFGIIDMVNQRLCERQEALGGRLRIPLISPSKCATTPPPADEPEVTLTANPTSITAGESTTLTWTSSDATSCTAFLGWSGEKALNGSQSVSPTETTTYQLDCTGDGGVGSDDATVTVIVDEEPDAPSVEISADPMTIVEGSTTTLTWNSENADTCTASNGWSGSKGVDDSQDVSPTETTTYAISCSGDGGTATDSVTVTVTEEDTDAPSVDLTASRASVTPGEGSATTTLTWTTTDAIECTASGGAWSGSKSVNGTETLTPTATTTYTLTCSGDGGSASDSVTVDFVPTPETPAPDAPTLSFSASRTDLDEGSAGNATSTLTWDSENADTCTASNGWSGSKDVDGSEIVTPIGTTSIIYVLTCEGDGGSIAKSVTVTFASDEPLPTVTLTASRESVHENSLSEATTTLTWESTDATSCVASNGWSGEKGMSGSETLTPGATTTYAIECTGDGGTAQESVTVDFVEESVDVPEEGALLITEVLYDNGVGQGTEPGNEWIELFNGTDSAINFSGYYLYDASSSDPLPDMTLAAGAFAIITGSSTTAALWPDMPADTLVILLPNTTIGNGLGNTGDMIRLENSASTTVDMVSWGSNTAFDPSVSLVAAGHSIARSSATLDTDSASDWIDRETPNPGQ